MRIVRTALTLVSALALAATASAQSSHYHVVKKFTLGGAGSWDYLAIDTIGHRLFIAHENRVTVVDPATGHILGEIMGLNRAHGVAFAYPTGHGFITSGGDSTVFMFDLKTLKVLAKTTAAVDCDAILYDPASKRVFTFNGDAGSSSVIDAETGKRITNITLPGKPEFGVTAGNGKLYVNIEDKSEIAEIDSHTMRVTRHWSLAPCQSPSGLAIDAAHHRLFSGCHSKVIGISDAVAGKVIATAPIGTGVDANRFDPATQYAFASTGDGHITVVHEDTPNKYTVVDNVTTMSGARTMALDPQTHRLYTVSAQFGPAPAAAPGTRVRPPMIPGTFTLLVLER
jgi:DNA-binding beta-propeller fold protein YncE